jgi:hypothetical protein
MKRTLMTFAAVMCLAAAPMVAQEADPLDPNPGLEQPAPLSLQAPMGTGAHSLTGTLLEMDANQIVVRTPTGDRLIHLGEVRVPAGIRVGDGIAVDYRVQTGGEVVIDEIRPFGGRVSDADVQAAVEPQPTAATTGQRMTVTGTVTEITDTELVLRTDMGIERYRLAEVRMPAGVRVGDRVTVGFTRTPEDVRVVHEVRPFTTGLTTTGTVVEVTPTELVVRTELGLQRFRIEEVQVPVGLQVGDRVTVAYVRSPDEVMIVEDVRIVTLDQVAVLPATGSTMPRVALFGLLALLGAVAVRLSRAA